MLQTIRGHSQVLAATLILAFAFVIGRWVKMLLEQILLDLGFDTASARWASCPQRHLPRASLVRR
jgi:hypothetical protein